MQLNEDVLKISTIFLYKSKLYKNNEVEINKNIRTN